MLSSPTAIAPRFAVQRTPPTEAQRPYQPYGAALDVMYARDDVVVLSGPAGTGKSRGNLEKLHLCCMKYSGMRGIMLRKTRKSLTESGMVTFEQKVLPANSKVRYANGRYRYPNGSVIICAGMDKPGKVMSSEYDMAVILEMNELEEEDLEAISTRMRNGVMPYQQILGDVNPQAPTHWIKRRADRGDIRMLESKHEDNPTIWDRARGAWTAIGAAYIEKLDKLTGARKLRLRFGKWAASEGMIYTDFERSVHVIDAKSRPDLYDTSGEVPTIKIPADWSRYRCIDFGFTNPFVCQWWAVDGDGRMYMYRELYGTQRIVEDWAKEIVELSKGETIVATIADHDAEDRATAQRKGVPTIRARKVVSPGIQAVQARLRRAGDGRPRIFFLADALVRRDSSLDDAHKPASTVEEFDGYVWAKGPGGIVLKEQPHKENDHGMDTTRYAVAHIDRQLQGDAPQEETRLF